ncbi:MULTISPECIES: hypothetical protein [unclassified Novosphingobium]|uniref:hypothetical protein n=1 Tax=unclassified Novosphingobium TaxID=2644732 RepID=UPI0003B600CE|nr:MULTISPECIES: hypothetical protein [unclassified Novosphingobium]
MFAHRNAARAALLGAMLPLALGSLAAHAQTAVAPKDAKVGDVVATPLETVNLKKEDIPPILQRAQETPYTLAGLRSCPAISSEIRRLDAVLGDDIDIADYTKGGLKVGNTAKSIVGSLIPFGGIIREISGANEAQRRWQVALFAGTARRSFLKGVGQSRSCPYPARGATSRDASAVAANRAREAAAADAAKEQAKQEKRNR